LYERLGIVTNGSLLHDIGKAVYRNDHSFGNHSNAGAEFLKDDMIRMTEKKETLDCVKYHHHHLLKSSGLENDNAAYIVYEADNIASGLDRRLIYDGVDEKNFDERIPLHSVFNQLNNHRGSKTGAYPLKPRFLSQGLALPSENIESLKSTTTMGGYGSILAQLKKGLSEMNWEGDSPNSLLKLLEATTTSIPSSTNSKEIPDISLYDHSKITCALASSMYIYAENNGISDYKKAFFDSKDLRNEGMFLLASGDVSGIQDFIYTISSKGALKSLRGRSLYLEMLLECVIDDILERFGLTRANLIYSGGGHFYMLLPNIEEVRSSLDEIKININKELARMFSVSLYLEIAYQECSAEELGNGLSEKVEKSNLLGGVFSKLSGRISANKLQRYKGSILGELFDTDSEFNAKTQNERECVICGESNDLVPFQRSDDTLSCRNCNELASLGTKIASIRGNKDKFLIVLSERGEKGVALPTSRGKRYLDIESISNVEEKMKQDPDHYWKVYSINEPMTGQSYSTNLWIGNYNKRLEHNKAIEFGDLALLSTGIKRLGVLRADVDDLGHAFTRGFERTEEKNRYDYITFSRTATFSREMTMFFKYEINKLCDGSGDSDFGFRLPGNRKNRAGQEKNIVIVYSGGDDVFVVGPWDEILEFSINLRDSFQRYSMDRLSLSAGIGLFSKGYPISQMAIKTGTLESMAKDNTESYKDSVALFGTDEDSNGKVFTWSELKENVCLDKMSKLVEWFYFDESEKSSAKDKLYAGNSLLYKLYELFNYNESINIARLAYLLGRLKPSDKEKDKLPTYNALKDGLYSWALDDKNRKAAAMAINLLIMLNRSEKEDKNGLD
jgi:CRISPR-associated protein Csm1